MRGAYGSETSHLNHQRVPSSSQTSMSHLVPLLEFNQLCRKAGGELEQIQLLLGHASIQTTERYLGTEQNLTVAVNDVLGLEID